MASLRAGLILTFVYLYFEGALVAWICMLVEIGECRADGWVKWGGRVLAMQAEVGRWGGRVQQTQAEMQAAAATMAKWGARLGSRVAFQKGGRRAQAGRRAGHQGGRAGRPAGLHVTNP